MTGSKSKYYGEIVDKMIAEMVFWASVVFIFYVYFGYPLALALLSVTGGHRVKKGNIVPKVSFVITAYNEEKRIKEKIENTLKQDYPKEKLEIIVASDCSTDTTDDIAKMYSAQGVKLVRAPERMGKENAQKYAVDVSTGDILVFSDVATILQVDGVSNIVRNFNDPAVGCVSSIDRFVDKDGQLSGEGAYVKYEMFLRGLETRVNTLVGLSGSFFAARKEVCRDWAVDLQSDFNTLLNAVKMGLRGVSDPESVGYYRNIVDEKKEFERKVRTVLRGISVFMKSLYLLNPLKYGLFSWQFFSHKLCRWLVPFAMIFCFISNAFLVPYSRMYLFVFVIQSAFYVIAWFGIWTNMFAARQYLKVPSFFFLVNLSILHAWFRYFRGEQVVRWTPSER
jgi:cellulose synthase/poly-beta-1,6-N-acetylglucosamine synthase-like glycosyltransferase